MSNFKCDPCECPEEYYRDDQSFNKAIIQLLCDIQEALGGGVGATYWDRVGTTLVPHTAGDDVDLGTGDITAATFTGGTFSGAFSGTFTLPAFTQGSVLFAGVGGAVSEDNTDFNYNSTTNLLTLGGNINYTAATMKIASNFADASDTATLNLCGGGDALQTRGAYIALQGNDVGGANTGGKVIIATGGGTNGTIDFYTESAANTTTQKWQLGIGTATVSDLIFGTSALAATVATIRGARPVNNDDSELILVGGGAYSNGRGAYLELKGENFASGAGNATLNYSGSGYIQGANNDSSLYFLTNNGSYKWQIPGTATATVCDLVFGDAATASSIATVRGSRADGSDDGTLNLCGGGALGTTRGASITLKGNDVGGAGAGGGATYEAGTGTTAFHYFNQAMLPVRLTSANKAAIAPAAAGMVVYDADLNKLCVYNGSAWTVVDGYSRIVFTIGDGNLAITTGLKKAIEVTQDCTITGWKILSDDPSTTAGDIVIDIWHKSYGAGYPPLVANTLIDTGAGGVKPTVAASATSAASVSVAHWTTALSAGDILRFNVDSVHTFTSITLILEVTLR